MTQAPFEGKGYAVAEAAEGGTAPTLYLYDILGEDLLGGVSARRVVEDLRALGEVPQLDVRVSSAGGDVFEGIAIYNALVRFPGRVTIHVDGLAASIASLVAMAGDRTLMAENAMLMVHPPWTAMAGSAEELRRQAETLDKAWSAMLATYARRTGRRASTLADRVAKEGGEWWMTAEEAVAEGFADGTEKVERSAAVFGLERFRRVPERLAARVLPADATVGESCAVPSLPRSAEIAPPRAERAPYVASEAPLGRALSRHARRRIVEVLRVAT